jgi:hypothetical protein
VGRLRETARVACVGSMLSGGATGCATPVDDTGSAQPTDCPTWPVSVGDAPLYGGNLAGTTVTGGPENWPLDIVRELPVEGGHVQLTNLVGQPIIGDFQVDGGLWMEAFWSPDGTLDVRYDTPLEVWRYPLEGSWTATATFSDALIESIPNQGIDTWRAEVVDTVDLQLDGVQFTNVRVVDAHMTRELALSTGPVTWTETAWISPCQGLLARTRDGIGMRLLP